MRSVTVSILARSLGRDDGRRDLEWRDVFRVGILSSVGLPSVGARAVSVRGRGVRRLLRADPRRCPRAERGAADALALHRVRGG